MNIFSRCFYIVIIALMLLYFIACGDDYIIKKPSSGSNDNGGHPPADSQTGILKNLEDPTVDVGPKDNILSKGDLAAISPDLINFPGKISITAFNGRSAKETRVVIVLTQSFFGGASLKGDIDDYFSIWEDSYKTRNLVVQVDSLNILPDPNAYQILDVNGSWVEAPNQINNYLSLAKASYDQITAIHEHTPIEESLYGGLRYKDGETNVIGPIVEQLDRLIKGIVKKAELWGANVNDIALVAFDPIFSYVIVDLAGKNSVNVSTLSMVTPVLAFQPGKYVVPNGLDATYPNTTYSKATEEDMWKKEESYKLSFHYLRLSKHFFSSFVGLSGEDASKSSEYNLLKKYDGKTNIIQGDKAIFVGTYDDDAEWQSDAPHAGFNLVLDNNGQSNLSDNGKYFLGYIFTSNRYNTTDAILGTLPSPIDSATFFQQPVGFHDFPTIVQDIHKVIRDGGLNPKIYFLGLKR